VAATVGDFKPGRGAGERCVAGTTMSEAQYFPGNKRSWPGNKRSWEKFARSQRVAPEKPTGGVAPLARTIKVLCEASRLAAEHFRVQRGSRVMMR